MNGADLSLNLTLSSFKLRLRRDVRDVVAEQPEVLLEKPNPKFHVLYSLRRNTFISVQPAQHNIASRNKQC